MARGTFSLSHHHLFTSDMGLLVPTACIEVLPGDSFQHSTNLLVRVAPLVNPLMHPVDVRIHSWFVPNRILWDGWDTWITGEDDVAVKPTVTLAGGVHSLASHMGIAPKDGLVLDALPFRAYNKIWNEFYRDQDLTAARLEDDMTEARISWGKDYFTVARDQPTGGEDISIPFDAGMIPLSGLYVHSGEPHSPPANGLLHESDGSNIGNPLGSWGLSVSAKPGSSGTDDKTEGYLAPFADLSDATGGIDITDFQRAMALRRFEIARARFGDRYVDYLRYLGVNPSDGRLDRPEYLGGGKQTISFSEVLATAEGATTNVGDMFGHGLAALRTRRYRKMFEEHGWMIQLASIRPRTMYQDNVPRKFTRTDPMDYWQRELEVEPWQSIPESEVHKDGDPATIFGWQNKYEEYRHELSFVSGSFRGGTEEDWHMARTFATPPTLNQSFVECTPTDRVYADTSIPEVMVNARQNIRARRLLRQHASLG